MESELQKFRRNKQLAEKKEKIQSTVSNYWNSWVDSLCNALLPSQFPTSEEVASIDPEDEEDSSPVVETDRTLHYIFLGLVALTWTLFYVAFIKIGFGAVFFTLSLLLFIYFNTKTSGRRKGEASAYSVFNKGCESLDGAISSEQLEKQLLFR